MPIAQPETSHAVTEFLKRWELGDREALGNVIPMVYDQLRQQARFYLRKEAAGHTLEPTALVNAVYLRLVDDRGLRFENRERFFAYLGLIMRRILVEYARMKQRRKRGGGERAELLLSEEVPAADPRYDWETLLSLDEALQRLKQVDNRKFQIVEWWFFAGLRAEEIATALDVSAVTIRRELRVAKQWLAYEIGRV